MKKCKKCGTIQDDSHFFCMECNERLGSPLTKEEEDKMNEEVKTTIQKLSDKTDYFHVSKLDKSAALLLLLGEIIYIIMFFNRGFFLRDEQDLALGLLAVIVMPITAVDLLFPKISWCLFKMRFSFWINNADDIVPNEISLFMKRAFYYIILFFGYILMFYIIVKSIIEAVSM